MPVPAILTILAALTRLVSWFGGILILKDITSAGAKIVEKAPSPEAIPRQFGFGLGLALIVGLGAFLLFRKVTG